MHTYFRIFIQALLLMSTAHSHTYINQPQTVQEGNCICICQPKCGTHLLLKCLTLLELRGVSYNYQQPIERNSDVVLLNTKLPPHHFKGMYHIPTCGPMPKNLINAMSKYANRLWWTHWMYTPEFADFVTQHSFAVFFMIRDPRDQIVSMARMVQHGFEANQTGDLEQIILDLIDGRQCHFLPWGVERNGLYPIEWEMGVVPFYQAYMPWTTRPKVLVVKFEDLVGPSGGGSSERQLRCIQEIGSHMGSALSPERAQLLAATLFGESATFSEGKIGSWKQHFTQQMKDAFAKAGGIALLQRLGYES